MERDYRYFRLKYSELRRKCRDEIYEIVKENVEENGEERIDIGYDDEGNGILMKVSLFYPKNLINLLTNM